MIPLDDATLAHLQEQSEFPEGIAAHIESVHLKRLLEERAHNLWLLDKSAEQLGHSIEEYSDLMTQYAELHAEHNEMQTTAMAEIEALQRKLEALRGIVSRNIGSVGVDAGVSP